MAVLRLMPSQGSPTPVEIIQDKVVVGREPTCDVVVNDGSVSRKHATIERDGNGWKIVDQGSANGTFVDSQRVTELALRNGQELRFGAMAFRVEIEDEGATILTSAPDATVIQDSPVKRPTAGPPPPPPPPAPKPAPPWAAPRGPVVTPAPPLPTAPTAPARPASAPPPPPPRATTAPPPPPGAAGPPPLPPRPATSRPPATPPLGAGAPPPANKGRGPLFWVGGGCCGCLVLILVFLGVVGGGAFYLTSAAVATVRDQIADVKKGDMAAAYGRMSEDYRARQSMEDFVAFVDRHPSLKENTDSTFLSRNVQNDTASVAGWLAGPAGVKEAVAYTLVKEAGGWRISDIQFGDAPAGEMGGSSGASGGGATPGGGGSLRLETVSAEKSGDATGYVVAIKLRATGFGTTGTEDAPGTDLVLDLETKGPDGERMADLSRMELQTRDKPDGLAPPHVDFDVSVTLREAAPGNYVAHLTVRDQIGRDMKTHEVAFSIP